MKRPHLSWPQAASWIRNISSNLCAPSLSNQRINGFKNECYLPCLPGSSQGLTCPGCAVHPMLRCPSYWWAWFICPFQPTRHQPHRCLTWKSHFQRIWPENHIANADMPTAFVWAPTSLLFLLGDLWQALTLLISLSVPLWVHSFKLRRKNKTKQEKHI